MCIRVPSYPRAAYPASIATRVGAILALVLLSTVMEGYFAPRADARGADATVVAPCQSGELEASFSHQDAAGSLVGSFRVMAPPDQTCTLAGRPQITVQDATGNLVASSAPPDAAAGPVVTLSAGVGAESSFRWGNGCGTPPPGPLVVILVLPGDQGTVNVTARGGGGEGSPLDGPPHCLDPGQPTHLDVTESFKAAPGQVFVMPDHTTRFVGERFFAYWRMHGGLALNGYPLTDERNEQLEDGRTYAVQYFERVRMEYHPEHAGTPYEVLLGQFGRHFHPADPPAAPLPDALYFAETGHNLRAGFRAFWEANGGLAQFGYPLTEEFTETLEDGKSYAVQYFERARMEYHPEHAGTPYEVLLGQFGRRILNESPTGR